MNIIDTPLLRIHFTGICGFSTGSLAILMKKRGHYVSGSDLNIYPPMSIMLEQHQIVVNQGYKTENIHPETDLVVIGNAISRGNVEVETVLSRKLSFVSSAELLRNHFIRGNKSLVVCGTHGKTTVTSLIAWVFEKADLNPGFMIGGIANNFSCSCQEGNGKYFITEGDEYDTAFFDKRSKFLHYLPEQLIINNLEFDHADIFDSLYDIEKSFRMLLRLVPEDGQIFANGDDPAVARILESSFSPITRFGTGPGNDLRLTELDIAQAGIRLGVTEKNKSATEFFIPLHGEYNARNVLGVIGIARMNGITDENIQEAFNTFRSVKRRLELRGEAKGVLVYDDFAHHPTAVRETIHAIRGKHPERRILAIFEPRSNTSVLKIHQQNLMEALLGADRVLLSMPYKQDQIAENQRLDVKELSEELTLNGTPTEAMDNTHVILDYIKEDCQTDDVILIMSNGFFENLHERLLHMLNS